MVSLSVSQPQLTLERCANAFTEGMNINILEQTPSVIAELEMPYIMVRQLINTSSPANIEKHLLTLFLGRDVQRLVGLVEQERCSTGKQPQFPLLLFVIHWLTVLAL